MNICVKQYVKITFLFIYDFVHQTNTIPFFGLKIFKSLLSFGLKYQKGCAAGSASV